MSNRPADHELNAAQQEVLERLGRPRGERPTFDAGLAARLREDLEDALGAVAERVDPDRPLFITKHLLAGVLGCEASFLHEQQQGFAWNPHMANGAVAHKAVELGINWHRRSTAAHPPATPGGDDAPARQPPPVPPELVDAAIDSLVAGDAPLAAWLATCSDADVAELRSLAVGRVAAFSEGWPPLKPRWRPVTESRSRVELCGGRIQLGGKTDLTLGASEGRTAGKVIIDLKSGRRLPSLHRDDLRFYALVETMKLGTPPRALATYYLESAHIDVEEVSEAVLETARNRTIDAVRRHAELRGLLGPAPEPTKRPGPPCRWCPLLDDCNEGHAYLAGDDDR